MKITTFQQYVKIFILTIIIASHGSAGTLIVTYQTKPNGERLDRVRFFLMDELERLHMYPKEDGYLESLENKERMVVIENLMPGEYTLEFVFPNTDGFFEEVPPRQFYIGHDTILKIDQVINPSSMKSKK